MLTIWLHEFQFSQVNTVTHFLKLFIHSYIDDRLELDKLIKFGFFSAVEAILVVGRVVAAAGAFPVAEGAAEAEVAHQLVPVVAMPISQGPEVTTSNNAPCILAGARICY